MSEHSFEEHLANEDDFELRSRAKKRRVAVGIASAVANIASSIVSFAGRSFNYGGGRKSGAKTIKRDRVDIDKQIHQLDDRHFRRKYRMDKDSFYQLLDIISPHLPQTGAKRTKPGTVPNGKNHHVGWHHCHLTTTLKSCW
jgi:hypothetical protein